MGWMFSFWVDWDWEAGVEDLISLFKVYVVVESNMFLANYENIY